VEQGPANDIMLAHYQAQCQKAEKSWRHARTALACLILLEVTSCSLYMALGPEYFGIWLLMLVLSSLGALALVGSLFWFYFAKGGRKSSAKSLAEYQSSLINKRLVAEAMEQARASEEERQRAYLQKVQRLSELHEMDPHQFEVFVGSVFRELGYEVSATPVTGDQGVDLFVKKDGRRSIVQVKRYAGTVGQPVVRDLYGAMLHHMADSAFLVTTGHFSARAEAWASNKAIELVDGMELLQWLRLLDRESEAAAEERSG